MSLNNIHEINRKIGKNMIFWRKIVIFHTKYPKNVRASTKTKTIFQYLYKNLLNLLSRLTTRLHNQGRIQDFKLGRGAHLKKLGRAEGGANIFGVFRVKNHDFTPKNHIFSNFKGAHPAPDLYIYSRN
jgi:hypothetical protein